MTRSVILRAAGALGFALVLALVGCDRSPAEAVEPITPTPSIHRLVLFMSSTVAAGRTLTPVVGAYKDSSSYFRAPVDFFYPAPADGLPVFASSDARVVRVNADGTLTAVALGSAYVKVALYGKRDSLLVSVIPGYDVALLTGTDSISLVDVNDAGDVAGYIFPDRTIYTTPGNTGILLRGGQRIELGNCYPVAINNTGQIACNEYGPGGRRGSHPAIFVNGAITFPFGSTANSPTGTVSGISESGRIFGKFDPETTDSTLRYRTFVGGAGGIDYIYSSVNATGRINSLLHGAATSGASCLYCAALIIRLEGPVGLGGLGRYSSAFDINDADNVIGSGEDFSIHGSRPMLWRKSNGWKAELFSPRVAGLLAISERDQIVGTGADGSFVWEAGRYTVLADAIQPEGWKISAPIAISRSGVIAARGQHPTLGRGIVIIRLP